MEKQKSPFKRRAQLVPSPINMQQVNTAVKTFQSRIRDDDQDSNALSDTTSMKLTKKKQRKEARKKARLAREG